MDVEEDLGENERDQGNRHISELALLGIDCQATNGPHPPYDQPVVLLNNIRFERYWLGVLSFHVGYLFETGNYKELGASPSRGLPLDLSI
jgi:hypothetical protein